MKKLIAFFMIAALLIALVSVISFADFGDFGGDNDFGDFDFGGGGGDWDWDDDDDDGGGGLGGLFFLGGLGGGGSNAALVIIVIVIFVIIALVKNKRKAQQTTRVNVGDRSTPQSILRPISEYGALDPDFNAADFCEKASNLYVRMQNGWTAGDISDLRPYFTDALFTQFERQLAQKKAQGLTNYIERISVQNVVIRGFRQESGKDHIIVQLETRIVDYTVDRAGKVVSGSRDREKFMVYEWDMCRTTGFISLKRDGIGRIFCPNCGAPLDINVSARCEYCGGVITSSDHDWAICRITALSQRTI